MTATPARILFVDDDPLVLTCLKGLMGEHFSVVTSREPTEALVRAAPFDVVVADYYMPQVNGVEFLHMVGRLRPESARLLMSGAPDLPQHVGGKTLVLVRKPITGAALRRTIHQVLAARLASPTLTQRKILIVDDSETAIEATQLALGDIGYTGIGLTDPFRLIESIRREKPAAILLDVSMPALDGTRLVAVMRQFDFLDGAKIILHSAAPWAQLETLAKASGADGFIQKTADSGHYERCLARILTPGT